MFEGLRALFRDPPPLEMQHPELGLLKLEGPLWNGELVRDGRKIKFVIAGSRAGPDDRLLATLREIVGRLPERESLSRAFIASHDSRIDPGDFSFCSIDILWPKRPDCYYFEYKMAGDEYAIWRVEFQGNAPKYLGRDN